MLLVLLCVQAYQCLARGICAPYCGVTDGLQTNIVFMPVDCRLSTVIRYETPNYSIWRKLHKLTKQRQSSMREGISPQSRSGNAVSNTTVVFNMVRASNKCRSTNRAA